MSQTIPNSNLWTKLKFGAKWCSQNPHFMVVSMTLAVVWLGWNLIMFLIGGVFHKEAIAWPAGVEVHPTEFRMLSLATSFGPNDRFTLVADGERFFAKKGELFLTSKDELLEGVGGKVLIYKNRNGRQVFKGSLSELRRKKNNEPVLDGLPDGENTIKGEVLESLTIGTTLDSRAYPDRKSAWYVSRTYVDTTKSRGERYWLWQLDVTYYTGSVDKAPHFPERCLQAGGMTLGKQGNTNFNAPQAPGLWGSGPFACRYVQYENPGLDGRNLNVQYYVYSLNGLPEASWKKVRWTMAIPFGKYFYFAKIQFNPVNTIGDAAEAQKATQEFVKYMLPEVLKSLPTTEDIKRLESGAQQAEKNSN